MFTFPLHHEWISFVFIHFFIGKFFLQESVEEDVVVSLDDDTEVDEEYFGVLSAGTVLKVSLPGEVRTPNYIEELATVLHRYLEQEPDLHQRVHQCLQEPVTPHRTRALFELLAHTASDTISLTSRDMDPDWFKGRVYFLIIVRCNLIFLACFTTCVRIIRRIFLVIQAVYISYIIAYLLVVLHEDLDTKYNTKEDVMRNNCEVRMRGYFNHTRHELLTGTPQNHPHISSAITFFRRHLQSTRSDYTRSPLCITVLTP